MYLKRNIPSPCMGCEERHIKCHGSCDKYKAFQEAKDAEYKKMTSAYAAEYGIDDYEIQRVRKIKKRSNKRYG